MHSGQGLSLKLKEASSSSSSPTSISTGGVPNAYDGKIAGLYDLEATLGSGHFAVVKLARHVFTGAKVAVKVVDKTKLDDVSKAHLFQEVRCMKLVQHPNVVRLYEVIDTQTKLYLVLELGDGGDLYDYIMKHEGGLNEELARKYFRQILRAITYCHQLHVVHRDLKPENVVFFEKLGVVKLTDFGFSNKFSPGQKLETFCGSLAYSAPEILLGDSYDAPAVDIWSLGVILYMLVCGQPPFEKANDSETLTMIMDCKYTVPSHISDVCQKLIASMLVRDPKKRANLKEIAEHPWSQENTDDEEIDLNVPLVTRQQLCEDDHSFIIQKMVKGGIASKEEIVEALDKNIYNHITATYFLLAEIRLRKRREEENIINPNSEKCQSARCATDLKGSDHKQKALLGTIAVPIKISGCPPTSLMNEVKTDKRNRKCSIVREEDEDESGYENAIEGNELSVAITRRESISDGRLNRSIQERTSPITTITVPLQAYYKGVPPINETLTKKINKIEEGDCNVKSEIGSTINCDEKASDIQSTLRGLKDLEIGKFTGNRNPVLTHRRAKLHKIRTPSCSSSEASDDDTKSRNKKKLNKLVGDTPTRFRMHRRDSHDDSSDSQDQAFPSSGGSQGHTSNIVSTNNSNVSGKKDNRTQGREQNKSDNTRKSSNTTHSQKSKKQPKEQLDTHSVSDKPTCISVSLRRRRVRESQSLDRITEAQEYELRHRIFLGDTQTDRRNSVLSLSSFTVAETKEEYDENVDEINVNQTEIKKNWLNTASVALHLTSNKNNLSPIRDIELNAMNKCFNRGTKCLNTMNKFRRLGKFFPVVNFS